MNSKLFYNYRGIAIIL